MALIPSTPKEFRERKPHQAFKKAKELQDRMAKRKTGAVSSGYWRESLKTDETLNNFLRVVYLAIFVLLGYSAWLAYQHTMAYNEKAQKAMSDREFIDRYDAYKFLTKSGEMNMRGGAYIFARQEFERALKAYPEGEEAAFGLLDVLCKDCRQNGANCKEADAWAGQMKKQFTSTAHQSCIDSLIYLKP